MSTTAEAIAIADALVEELNRPNFQPSFKAERKYVPRIKLEEMGDKLHAIVAARTKEKDRAARGVIDRFYTIDFALQKRLAPTPCPEAQADEILLLAERIDEYFEARANDMDERPLASYSGAQFVGLDVLLYVPDVMHELAVVFTLLTFQFKTRKTRT